MGKSDLKTVIAPSRQARLSDLQIRNVIKGLIGRSLDVFLRKRGMTIGLIFFICTSMTSTVRAECVPYPDCASIGYTETSCETQAVKCPFDGSKLYCLPCDSKYQYTCNGVGEVGEGAGCKGKYEVCGCANNYVSFCDVIFCS